MITKIKRITKSKGRNSKHKAAAQKERGRGDERVVREGGRQRTGSSRGDRGGRGLKVDFVAGKRVWIFSFISVPVVHKIIDIF